MTTVVDHEPLDAATWFDRMGRFVAGLDATDGTPSRHIRKAYHLHCLAPHPLKAMMAAPLPEERLEAMLECGAYESAVTSLIGKTGRVTVAPDATDGGIEVRLRVDPASPADATASETWPTAMLEAWAVSFLRLRPLTN